MPKNWVIKHYIARHFRTHVLELFLQQIKIAVGEEVVTRRARLRQRQKRESEDSELETFDDLLLREILSHQDDESGEEIEASTER